LEAELERFYTVYVEKFTNIDFLEHELDLYNLKSSKDREKQQEMINKFVDKQRKADAADLFNDGERDEEEGMFPASEEEQMRKTQSGFGDKKSNWKAGNEHAAMGGL